MQAKVYSDGSHYIAIPRTTNPYRRRVHPKETEIEVTEEAETPLQDITARKFENLSFEADNSENEIPEKEAEETESKFFPTKEPVKVVRKMTRKELFNKLYDDTMSLRKNERKAKLIAGMRPYFRNEQVTRDYVEANLRRKKRNLICRRIRFTRKANLQRFNYFVTFTYDGKIHTEESFKKGLSKCLQNLHTRKGWKYMGVWERSPKKGRLHFHGLLYIPEGAMQGELFEKKDYNFNTHRIQTTVQNTYFNARFGRCDFESIVHKNHMGYAVAYIMKYMGKSEEKIVYSRGLPDHFVTDVEEDDVVTRVGIEDRKLLLFDDFKCRYAGLLIGRVCAEAIRKLCTLERRARRIKNRQNICRYA